MSDRRLLFYNDSRHFYLYCYEPPISIEDAQAPVDEIAGTRVDTFVYSVGPAVGDMFGPHIQALKDIPSLHRATLPVWRAYENIKSLKARGVDLLRLLVERAHERGLAFYATLDQNSGASPHDVDNPYNRQFKIDHPEWCIKGRGKYAFNFAYPEVRAERLAVAEEVVNRYDIDGLELALGSSPHFFEENEVERNTPILTEYVRQHRRMIERAASQRGGAIALGARVLPTRDGNLAAGMDVATWVKEDLLDFVTPNIYNEQQMDADFPFEWLVELTRGTGCQVFPALGRQVGRPREPDGEPVGEEMAGAAHYHAGAAAYWSKGADGIYLPWFNWPIRDPDRRILSEINSPVLLVQKTKHYVVYGHNAAAADCGYTAQLPVHLISGTDAPAQEVRLFIADDPDRADATLRVRLRFTTVHDLLTVSLNGHPLPNATCRREPHNYTPTEAPRAGISSVAYTWLEYPVPRGTLRNGANSVGVAIHARPPNLQGQVVLGRIDLIVTYPGA